MGGKGKVDVLRGERVVKGRQVPYTDKLMSCQQQCEESSCSTQEMRVACPRKDRSAVEERKGGAFGRHELETPKTVKVINL